LKAVKKNLATTTNFNPHYIKFIAAELHIFDTAIMQSS